MPTQTDQNSALEGGFLFHLTEDPEQNVNLIHALPQEEKRMIALLKQKMIEADAPEEQWIEWDFHGRITKKSGRVPDFSIL